ncbi:MAG: PD-(D/E)XK nuclease family transposase [Prevotella sp.]|nr:PD-(D/E)XK nuclease family transposase [Prevotella sp.]
MADEKNDNTYGTELLEPQERYINPYTDFGFKKLFGTEMNKDLLISFLNALFSGSGKVIEDVQYLNSEHLGDGYGDRRAVFDVYCKTKEGGRFIVEMQRANQDFFKDRSLYYSTFAIREQTPKAKHWDYQLEDVYTIGVLNFTFPDNEYPADSYKHEVKLKDVDDNHVFYDKLTLIYLEMPKFNKTEDELVTMFDKWMFVLRNLGRLLERPKALQDRIFKKLFEQAEIAQYTPAERREYEASVKNYWDYYSTMKSALNRGRAEGRAEAALKMKGDGMASELIAKYTGLTIDEIAQL